MIEYLTSLLELPLGRRLRLALRGLILGREKDPSTPRQPRIFQPFLPAAEGPEIALWPRADETNELHSLLSTCAGSYLIVTGASGCGKSTLVTRLYKAQYCIAPDAHYYEFNSYDNIVVSFLTQFRCSQRLAGMQEAVICETSQALPGSLLKVTDPYDMVDKDPVAEKTWGKIEEFLNSQINDPVKADNYLFVFDQIERFLFVLSESIANKSDAVGGLELYLIRKILSKLRECTNCRMIFVMRDDFLYKSMDFLKIRTCGAGPGTEFFKIYMCRGLNTESSPYAVERIRLDFSSLHFVSGKYPQFSKVLGIATEGGANAFLTQLVGFMVEHYYQTDRQVKYFLVSATNPMDILPIFFGYVQDGFGITRPDSSDGQLFRAVLFAIACENKTTGASVYADRVAALTHVPTDFVAEIFEHMIKWNIVILEQKEDGVAIRFAHDLLSDFILHSEYMSFMPELKDCIMKLSEARVQTKKMVRISDWAHFIDDIAVPNIGLAAIWAFYIWGAVKLASSYGAIDPKYCAIMEEGVQHMLVKIEIFQVTGCKGTFWAYTPIYLMHCLWVTYIYCMNRNYIQLVTSSLLVRWVGNCMAVIGALFGIILSFSPIVHVVPIMIVGLIFALLLLYVAYENRNAADFSRLNVTTGTFSLLNMVFCVVLVLLVWLTYPLDSPSNTWFAQKLMNVGGARWLTPVGGATVIGLIWLYITVMFMIYYWASLRFKHQSAIAAANKLAVYDRSRILGRSEAYGRR